MYAYLHGKSTGHRVAFVRPALQRDDLPLWRVDQQLLHAYDAQTEELVRLDGVIVDFEQQFRSVRCQVTKNYD